MGRLYAGILGPVAFATVLGRSLVDGGGVAATLQIATACLFGFAAIGYVTGRLAEGIVTDSVHSRFRSELKTHEAAVLANSSAKRP